MISKTSALTVLIAALGFLCFSITPASAKDATAKQTIGGLSCGDGQGAKFNSGTGSWVCAPYIDTDTSAADCASGELLDGDGNCIPIPSDTLRELEAAGPEACPDGSLARLDPGGSGVWQCLSLAELKELMSLSLTVFVTSTGYTGDLVFEANTLAGNPAEFTDEQGIQAGDFICNWHAGNAQPEPLEGSFVAWTSDPTNNALDKLPPFSGPFVKLNGELVAETMGDLTTWPIKSPIDVTENGGEADFAPRMDGNVEHWGGQWVQL